MTTNTNPNQASNTISNNRPAYQAVVPIQGDNAETTWKRIGAAWPAKGNNGFNLVLTELPFIPDGKQTIYLRPRQAAQTQQEETPAQ